MRRLVLVLVTFGAILLVAYQGEAVVDPEAALGIWLLDEDKGNDVADSSGNEHDGVIVGSLDWVDGKFGGALEFPGPPNNYVKIDPFPGLNTPTFTIVLWYKGTPSDDKWQDLAGKSGMAGARNYHLLYLNENGAPRVVFTIAGAGKPAAGRANLGDDKWHHVAGTYDGQVLKLWVDGVVDAELVEAAKPDAPEADMMIGGMGSHPTKGIIDEVALFNTALGQEDIQDIMNNGLTNTVKTAVSSRAKLAAVWGGIKSE